MPKMTEKKEKGRRKREEGKMTYAETGSIKKISWFEQQ